VELLLADLNASLDVRRQGLEDIRQALRRIRDIVQRIGGLRDARSKDYLRGVRMLDLDRDEQGTPALDRGAALVHVPDEDLARIVSLLLRGAGFQVQRHRSVAEIQAGARNIGVSLVVLAGGARTPGAHALGGFLPDTERDYLVVALVAGEGGAARAAGADHVVPLPFDPGTFTAEILRRLAPASPADKPSP
jgi:signal transduction histidine kinase